MSYTRGPWKAERYTIHDGGLRGEEVWAVFATGQWPSDGVFLGSAGSQGDANPANARLIAASPQLLEAAQQVIGGTGANTEQKRHERAHSGRRRCHRGGRAMNYRALAELGLIFIGVYMLVTGLMGLELSDAGTRFFIGSVAFLAAAIAGRE